MKRPSRLVVVAACLALAMPALLSSTRAQPAQEQGSRLQGTASIDRRDRVVGAVVTVRPRDDAARMYMTSTDGAGVFTLDGLPNGDYEVILERSGFETVVKDGIGLKYPFRAVVEVTMQRTEEPAALLRATSDDGGSGGTVQLSGIARRRNGDPVGEVRVRLVHPAGKRDPRSVESDVDGTFRLDDLPAGDWILAVNAVGYLPLRVRLDVSRDSRLELSLVRQPADYEPSPLELMPPELPTPPPGFLEEPEQVQRSTISARTAK